MIVQPWKELANIERHLEIEQNFYTEERFAKRDDGFYCIKKEINKKSIDISDDDLICMPRSKGRSAKRKGTGFSMKEYLQIPFTFMLK